MCPGMFVIAQVHLFSPTAISLHTLYSDLFFFFLQVQLVSVCEINLRMYINGFICRLKITVLNVFYTCTQHVFVCSFWERHSVLILGWGGHFLKKTCSFLVKLTLFARLKKSELKREGVCVKEMRTYKRERYIYKKACAWTHEEVVMRTNWVNERNKTLYANCLIGETIENINK